METVLSTQGLSKQYGSLKAVDKLDLVIPKGSVFGLLGPNGSGKTTTLGMLLDVIQPTAGSYQWFGLPAGKEQRKRIGAILETPVFYPYLTARQNLKIVALIKEVPQTAIHKVLDQVGLAERQHDAFKTYSLGMKQRLSIASALLCNPEVMILDEPTNGLDPQGIAEIRNLIMGIAQQGKTIILASHLLDEVQKVCSDFAVLKKGKLIYTGKVSEVGHQQETTVLVQASQPLTELLNTCPMVVHSQVQPHGKTEVVLHPPYTASDLNKWLFEQNIIASHLEAKTKTLEKQFLELLENA